MSSDGEPQILVRALTKRYRSTRRRPLARLLGRGSPREARPALAELSFEVARGQALGVIGRNGSGKSTLLLDLTSGINPEFSGSENAVVLGMLAGHSRAQMNERMEEIRAFSGLGDAFDEPVKEYSAGMTLRLGFSAAVHTDPDVLLIDEALAVGDAFFQQRCLRRMREFRESGKTIVLVSHDPSAILSLCDRALWLEGGGCAALGDPEDVVRSYLAARYRDDCAIDSPLVAEGAPASPDDALQPAPPLASEAERFGDGRARIVGVAVRDDRGAEIDAVRPGQRVEVVITARARAELRSPLIGFTLRNRLGDVTTATNTEHAGYELGPLAAGESITVAFELGWPPLASGPVALSPAIADGAVAGHRMCDWVENPLVLHAENPRALFGWMSLEEVGLRAHREGAPVPEARIDEEADDTAERRILGAVDQPRDTGVPSADLGRDASLYVSGWAFASDGAPVEVEIRLGDGEPVCTPCRTFRGDVGAFHTSTPAAGRSGFGARVPSPGPGPARLRVEARSGSSRHLLDERELQLAPAGDPPGPATARRPPPRRAPAEPPHVLWLSHRLELEGAPRSLLEVAASLRDRYRMTVVSPSDGPLRKDWEAAGIPVVVEPFEIHKRDVPESCDALFVVSPQRPFAEEEVAIVERYLQSGGSVLLAFDPVLKDQTFAPTGFEAALEARGILVGRDLVIEKDPDQQLPGNAGDLFLAANLGTHPLVEGVRKRGGGFLIVVARSVDAVEGSDTEVLFRASPKAVAETDLEKALNPEKGSKPTPPRAVPLAVAWEHVPPLGEDMKPVRSDGAEPGRLLVVGDSDWMSSELLDNPQFGNVDLLSATAGWLTQREALINIAPRKTKAQVVVMSDADLVNLLFRVVVLLPLAAFIAGFGVWWSRRS